jgi:6-phosphogluconolactonase
MTTVLLASIVYLGTYTGEKSKGIYFSEFDEKNGKLGEAQLAAETVNPSFLAIHPNGKWVYAVGEAGKEGGVSAFVRESGNTLKFMNKASTGGAGPCYVSLDKTGKFVFAANYGSGSVAAFRVNADGSLGERTAFVQHQGSGANPKRQAGPHAHWIEASPDNRFVLAMDLGLDQVMVYKFNSADGTLVPNDTPFAKVAPGAGPRHFAFHPNGRWGYVINEMLMTVTAFSWDARRGELKELHTVSTLPEGAKSEKFSTAQILVHPSGKFLYGSNRGHDTIAAFTIGSDGRLTPLEHVSTNGSTPRNFNIHPSGNFLLAANQRGDNVVAFRIDTKTGRLTPAGSEIKVGSPVCIQFTR